MGKGTHDFRQDPRNAEILININGELFPREKAGVTVSGKACVYTTARSPSSTGTSSGSGKVLPPWISTWA